MDLVKSRIFRKKTKKKTIIIQRVSFCSNIQQILQKWCYKKYYKIPQKWCYESFSHFTPPTTHYSYQLTQTHCLHSSSPLANIMLEIILVPMSTKNTHTSVGSYTSDLHYYKKILGKVNSLSFSVVVNKI